ncbi:metalloprotease [Halobacteriales archaeon QS_5_68_33]|nr:MAG: metalloprotease [Halobacteriales archaeon QS_5_68_33]
MTFSARELRDLAVAWVALGVAFAVFLNRGVLRAILAGSAPPEAALLALALALSTAGLGFLLHELAHKVVAVRFGQVAAFRAEYGLLFLTVVSAFAGFLFAAPGAVVHRGRITDRENGLVALAGPVTNLLLVALFLPLAVAGPGLLGTVGTQGLFINLLLAGFNMIPFGPLDGRKVLAWSLPVYLLVAVPSIGLAAFVFFL